VAAEDSATSDCYAVTSNLVVEFGHGPVNKSNQLAAEKVHKRSNLGPLLWEEEWPKVKP